MTSKKSLEADGESTTKLTITILDKNGDALTDQKLTIEVVNNNDGTHTATYIAGIKTDEVAITAKTVLYWTGSRRGSLRSVQHPALTFQSARHDYLETGPSVPNCPPQSVSENR